MGLQPGVFLGLKVPMQGRRAFPVGACRALSGAALTLHFTLPYFSWENSCTMIPGSGSKEKLAGPRLQIS